MPSLKCHLYGEARRGGGCNTRAAAAFSLATRPSLVIGAKVRVDGGEPDEKLQLDQHASLLFVV
jgi:hypothetical protein